MDRLLWDEGLRWTRGHVRYTDTVIREAARVRRLLFSDEVWGRAVTRPRF